MVITPLGTISSFARPTAVTQAIIAAVDGKYMVDRSLIDDRQWYHVVRSFQATKTPLTWVVKRKFIFSQVSGRIVGSDITTVSSPPASYPPPPNPVVMPRIKVSPTMMMEVKEAMASTSEKILRLRLASTTPSVNRPLTS